MSFLEKEDEGKQSSFWDWVVGIGLVVVIGGFTVYYQYQKRSSKTRFDLADATYKSGHFKDAAKIYEELKSAQYLTTHDDSTIYVRMDSIETAQELQAALVAQLKAKAAAGDLNGILPALQGLRFAELLSDGDKAWIDSVKAHPPAPPDTTKSPAPANPASTPAGKATKTSAPAAKPSEKSSVGKPSAAKSKPAQ